jgi:MtN3 and saliva related transmembrane protein
MDWQDLLGYVAGALTTFAVVPQISKAWKTRAVNDISLLTVASLISGTTLWTVYGFITESWPIVVTNSIAALLNCILLGLVIHEKVTAGRSPSR